MSELYVLPEGWEWKEWKDIVNVKNGKHYKDVLNPNGKYPIYGSGGIVNYADEYLCNENTTIIGRKGTINSPIFVKEKFWNIDTAFGLEAKQEHLIPLYLYYFALHFDFLTLNKSTTLPSLAKSNLQKILMPLPPLQEQKRIVAKLDSLFAKIDKAIALHQQNIDEAEALMGAVLNEVFGELEERYGFFKLDEICKFSQGIQVPSKSQFHEYQEGLNKFVRIINYTQLSNEYRYVKEYSEKAVIAESDIVMVRYGATAGFVGRGQKGLLANNLFKITPREDYLKEFIYYGINNPLNQLTMYNNIGAAAMPAVNFGTMSLLKIPKVPLKTQQKTVQYLDQLSQKTQALKKEQQEKMQSLKDLKASILDRAFRGEL